MIIFENIIKHTQKRFLTFEFDPEMDNQNSIVIFLINTLKKSIEKKEQESIMKLADFINELISNENESIASLIDDIALTIHSEGCYKNIKPFLTKETNEVFEINIGLWEKGNTR
ncbi:hypothetical protein TMP248_150065 [Tenacibaculum maritimum]|uniref:hypothetical protein n=1 Tax=Tenacibaculum maritimum TaxID=107401 RepID=UPI0012E51DE3|nr:hypothetical protein [Tenacibaculum maritimum]CAA0163787.1 hypothetical protein JIP32914_120024 [Tenacibaculum maritimum]CAA0177572.1 hypothetical protein TMP248_150065 [Tenacibaculum maritimum]CAA0191104.1 hypothetical protein NCIMB2158_250038 [Tenacibaculum maritimum]CAA0231307.1 hypothetical protein TMP445_680003 [Tenacibaculum maritimum]